MSSINQDLNVNSAKIISASQTQPREQSSSTTSGAAIGKRVNSFFVAKKDHFFGAMKTFFSSCKTRLDAFYNKYSPIIKKTISTKIILIIMAIVPVALAYSFPILTLIGAAVGFATNGIIPNWTNNTNKIITPFNVALAAIAAVGLAMPACSLAAIAIFGGTLAIGRTLDNVFTMYLTKYACKAPIQSQAREQSESVKAY